MLEFEKKFSSCDDQTAFANIAEIIGIKQTAFSGPKWEAKYDYTDEYGKLLFQVIRYHKDPTTGKKRISQRRPLENGDWEWNTDKCRKVLYRLPEVLVAREILIAEGEKKVDLLREDLPEGVAATCSPGGAGKWRDEFAPYFAGRKAIIFPDNDEPGRKHALAIAHSVFKYAVGVKIVELPGLPEKGDVVDWYAAGHDFLELIAEVNKAPWWTPPVVENNMFVNVVDFTKSSPKEIDWLVEGLIQRGANGIMTARPKAGKSLAVVDLCLALAMGQSWVPGQGQYSGLPGFYIERPVKVALVSREDAPGLTQWRMMKIAAARQIDLREIRENLYVNSKQETSRLMLDDPDDMTKLLHGLEKCKAEFLVLDVLRRLHDADENDGSEMSRIIETVCGIQEKVGCQILVIHHDNKREDATLTERIRGSSAIAGFAEFVIGLKVVNPQEPKHDWVREVEVEIKAALPPDNFFMRYVDMPAPGNGLSVERVHWEPPKRGKKKADGLVDKTGQQTMPLKDEEQAPF